MIPAYIRSEKVPFGNQPVGGQSMKPACTTRGHLWTLVLAISLIQGYIESSHERIHNACVVYN